jgi:ATP synthase F1 gamma subunit
MISKKQIKFEIEGLNALKGLVEVYEEVAAGRMQRVRGAVVQSRQFLTGLLEVFKKARVAYSALEKNKWRQKNGKAVAVFVSANAGLYGDIVDRTFEIFAEYVEKNKPEVVVLGKLGLKMMNDRMPKQLFNYFDFSDEEVEMESFQIIMRYLIQFEVILVFYGTFKTILDQNPTMTTVSGEAIVVDDARVVKPTKFLFEPSVEAIAQVFEGEILSSLFEQTLHESQLAKFASRMLALDHSVDNIENRLGVMRMRERRVGHRSMNKKMLGTVSGIYLWGRSHG